MSTSPVTIHSSAAQAVADTVDSAPPSSGGCGCGGCGCGGGAGGAGTGAATVEAAADATSAVGEELDVRALVPAERHARIFGRVGALEPGEAFVLVNDHDPKPLRYQLDAEEPGQITWEYLEEGPEVWRVRIARVPGHCC